MCHEEHVMKTMTAVRGCISECLRTEAPISTLNQYVQGLRRNPQWDETEVAEVEAAARRAIEAARR